MNHMCGLKCFPPSFTNNNIIIIITTKFCCKPLVWSFIIHAILNVSALSPGRFCTARDWSFSTKYRKQRTWTSWSRSITDIWQPFMTDAYWGRRYTALPFLSWKLQSHHTVEKEAKAFNFIDQKINMHHSLFLIVSAHVVFPAQTELPIHIYDYTCIHAVVFSQVSFVKEAIMKVLNLVLIFSDRWQAGFGAWK